MVDFAKLLRERYEAMDNEGRARFDAREAQEEADRATEAVLPATFEALVTRPVASSLGAGLSALSRGKRLETETCVERSRIEPMRVRIEARGEGSERREILRFMDGPTGHEAYQLDEAFCRMLADPEEKAERPRFTICAGTAGRWDRCSVSHEAVNAYVRERRPELFPANGPSPSR